MPIVRQYAEDMQAAGQTELDYTSLEGFVDAVVFVEGLKRLSGVPSRASLLAALEGMNSNIGGLNVQFSASDHQALDTVYFTVIKGGRAVPISKF